jgi:PAS domain S-box-containing protein
MKYTYPEIGERDISVSYFPIQGTTGVDQAACIFQDITERKRAEEALRVSEERLRLAQWAARIGTFEWNIRTGVSTRTPELEAIYGVPSGSFGKTRTAFENLIHPDDRAGVIKLIDRSVETGQPTEAEWRVVWPDGSVHWIAARWQAIMSESGEPLRIVGLNMDVTKRKMAEEALRASEERMRLAQNVARIGSFEWNVQTGVNIWTPELEAMYGLPPGGFGGTESAFEKLVHPDDLPIVLQFVDEALKTGRPMQGEWRIIWPDGSVRWIAGHWQVFMNESGEPLRMLGVNMDVTDRKQLEEALSGMTQKLVEAQEQERARIARELHDDITQRLAMLAIEIEQVQECSEMPSEVRDRAHELSIRAKGISTDIQTLSHELHSSRLDYLGIVGGMKSWCNEFGERQGIEIEFNPGVQSSVSPEISLCLFRVLQEALHNAAKHSGVKRVDVKLREESGGIHLTISDLGKGFDVAAAMQDRGLGVTSIRERVRLVGGTVVIDSKPLGGTTIHVRVPLGTEHGFQRAAG